MLGNCGIDEFAANGVDRDTQIVFFTPGEVSAAQYTPLMSLRGSPGQLAAEIKAAVVMLERRCFPPPNSPSSPFGFLCALRMTAATCVLWLTGSPDRYWGNSTPFMVQDTEALKYLTLQNSIADLNYFARQVKLPFANQGGVQVKSNAPDVVRPPPPPTLQFYPFGCASLLLQCGFAKDEARDAVRGSPGS